MATLAFIKDSVYSVPGAAKRAGDRINPAVTLGQAAKYEDSSGKVWDLYSDPRVNVEMIGLFTYITATPQVLARIKTTDSNGEPRSAEDMAEELRSHQDKVTIFTEDDAPLIEETYTVRVDTGETRTVEHEEENGETWTEEVPIYADEERTVMVPDPDWSMYEATILANNGKLNVLWAGNGIPDWLSPHNPYGDDV